MSYYGCRVKDQRCTDSYIEGPYVKEVKGICRYFAENEEAKLGCSVYPGLGSGIGSGLGSGFGFGSGFGSGAGSGSISPGQYCSFIERDCSAFVYNDYRIENHRGVCLPFYRGSGRFQINCEIDFNSIVDDPARYGCDKLIGYRDPNCSGPCVTYADSTGMVTYGTRSNVVRDCWWTCECS